MIHRGNIKWCSEIARAATIGGVHLSDMTSCGGVHGVGTGLTRMGELNTKWREAVSERHRDIRPERKELADTNIAAWNNYNAGNYEKAAKLFDSVAEQAEAMRDKAEENVDGDVSYEPETTAEWIRERREALDMTQQELADELDVTVLSVGNWESGDSEPSESNLEKLEAVLDDG